MHSVTKEELEHDTTIRNATLDELSMDVIKELERIKIADNPYHEDEGFEHGIEKAISLIRDGVKP